MGINIALIELKACPFCGSKARFGLSTLSKTTTGETEYYVMCTRGTCGAVTAARAQVKTAANLWNKRKYDESKAENPR